MNLAVAIAAILLLAAVLLIVSGPLRRARRLSDAAEEEPRLAELEAAREAKYREIRDAELDFRTGKLSREDYEAVDSALRAEAIAILDRIERLRPL
jgi:flagellar biosynthesis/type III secretory pathway M-ring protein FliF/YscJ